MVGLMDIGLGMKQDAIEGFGDLGNMEVQRRKENAQLKAQAENSRGQMIGSIVGALASAGVNAMGSGAATGASEAGPITKAGSELSVGKATGNGMGAINISGAQSAVPQGGVGLGSVNMSSMQNATPHWLDIFPDY